MFNRARFLLIVGADPARWAAKHDIEPCTAPCYTCGAPRTTTQPFASGDLRGLMAPTCACGDVDGPYCIVRSGGRDLLDL